MYFSRVALLLIAVSFSGPMCAASCIDDSCRNVTQFESTGGAIEDDVTMLQVKVQHHEQQRKLSCSSFYGTSESCKQASIDLGLELGGDGYSFAGSYSTKGCYTYKSGDKKGIAYFGTGGSASEEKAKPSSPKIRLDCEDVNAERETDDREKLSCSSYTTPSNTDGQGGGFRRRRRNAQYLDRHSVKCSSSKVMSEWKLVTDSSARRRTQMHVKYSCCSVPSGLSCGSYTYSTPARDSEDGRSYAFDRHSVTCPSNKALQYWREQNSGANAYFEYKCCGVETKMIDCSDHYTAYSDDGGGNIVYLDRHDVRCPTNKVLRYFKMYRSSDHKDIRYRYGCCAIAKPTTTTTTTTTTITTLKTTTTTSTTTTTTLTGNPDDYKYVNVGGGQCIDEDGETLVASDPRSLGFAEPVGETPLEVCKEICSRNLKCGAFQVRPGYGWCWLFGLKEKPYVGADPYHNYDSICYIKQLK